MLVLQQRKSGDWLVTIADILLTIRVKLFMARKGYTSNQTTKLETKCTRIMLE